MNIAFRYTGRFHYDAFLKLGYPREFREFMISQASNIYFNLSKSLRNLVSSLTEL